jgi:hypothetical protein
MPAHPTIQQLLQEWRDHTGWSYAMMSKATGDVVARNQLHELTTGQPRSWPDTKTVIALAEALSVSEQTVVLGFATSLGLPITTEGSLLATMLPRSADYLTLAERTHVIGIVTALTKGRSETAGVDG